LGCTLKSFQSFPRWTTTHHGDDHHGRRRGKLSLELPYPPNPVARALVLACPWRLAAA
jgi:hypothetical protein